MIWFFLFIPYARNTHFIVETSTWHVPGNVCNHWNRFWLIALDCFQIGMAGCSPHLNPVRTYRFQSHFIKWDFITKTQLRPITLATSTAWFQYSITCVSFWCGASKQANYPSAHQSKRLIGLWRCLIFKFSCFRYSDGGMKGIGRTEASRDLWLAGLISRSD